MAFPPKPKRTAPANQGADNERSTATPRGQGEPVSKDFRKADQLAKADALRRGGQKKNKRMPA